ncbi:MAG: DUF819 family protein [Pseudomonadota bacterium]
MISSAPVLFGVLACILGVIFYTYYNGNRYSQIFYRIFPIILLCYFIPSVITSSGMLTEEGSEAISQLYTVASRYLLPAALVLLTMSIDLKRIAALGIKPLILFFTATIGIIIGGPIALLIVGAIQPEWVGGEGNDAVWKGMTTVAGSWIGGGANQLAMKETFDVGDAIFSSMIAVDVLVAQIWMAVILYMASRAKEIDAKVGADVRSIEEIKQTVEAFEKKHARIPQTKDFMGILAVGFGATAIGHIVANFMGPFMASTLPLIHEDLASSGLDSPFLWLILTVTVIGISLSFTPLKNLVGAGSSNIASVFIFILVVVIGLKMDITAVVNTPQLFVIGIIWMAIHASLMLIVARLIRAPLFFMAVCSQANVGGAASAPVVASAFHPSLAPVGALLAILGYAVGSVGAWICGEIMRVIATGG